MVGDGGGGGEINVLEPFGGQGFLKAGFLGFPKSGKTFTAAILAAEVHRQFKSKKPVAFFDTEAGAAYVKADIEKGTGLPILGKRSRALSDLMTVARECEAGAAGVLIVDSITHVWRECCDSYLKQVNAALGAQGKSPRNRLEFQDWSNIKRTWGTWTDFYLNSRLHIIICGRAGFEWDFEEHEDSAGNIRKELVKTGVKMKVESEFGFEPSLLVEMERVQVDDPTRKDRFRLVHRATVIGDRFSSLDGQSCDNPTAEFFKPHLARLSPGDLNAVDVEVKTDHGVDVSGDAAWQRERRQRTILAEEVQGEMVKAYPGQSAAEKKVKAALLEKCFGSMSWTKVENMDSAKLAAGLAMLRESIANAPAAKPGKEE